MDKQSTLEYANKHANKSQTHRHARTVNEQNEHSKTQNFTLGNQLNLCIKKYRKFKNK